MLQDQFTIKNAYDSCTTVFLFFIRLRFPKSKSISDILHRRAGQSALKRIRKFEKLDYRLRKAELDLEFLLGVKTAMPYLIFEFPRQ